MLPALDRPQTNHGTSIPRTKHRPAVSPLDRNAATPPALASAPTALTLLLALRRRWPRALALGLLCAVLAAAAAWLIVPSSKYTARAQLQIASTGTNILGKDPQISFQTYQQNQKTLIRSRLVLQTALEQPQVAALKMVQRQKNATEWLDKEIQAEADPGSEILRISMNGDDPDELPILVKAVTDAYLKKIANRELEQRRQRRDELQTIYDGYQERLSARRAELKKLAEDVGGTGDQHAILFARKFALESLAAAEKELLETQSKLQSAQIDLSAFKARQTALADMHIPDYKIDRAMQKDPLADSYYVQLSKLQDDMAQMERRFTSPQAAAPHLREFHKEIDSLKAVLAAYRDRIRPTVEAQLREEARDEFKAQLASLQDRTNKLQETEKGLTAKVNRLSNETRTIQKSSADLETKQAAIAKEEAISKKIGDEVETLTVELRAPPRVSLLEEAVVTRSRDESRPMKAAGLAALAAFAVVVFGVSWWEALARRIHTADDVSQGLGVKVLGTVPQLPAGCRALVAGRDGGAFSLLAESIDATRTMLLHTVRTENVRAVMVTSAVSGEGKTCLATQLAASLARSGLRTLLIDGDLRNPSAHQAFGLPLEPGLSELLRGEVELSSALRPTSSERLSFLSAGQCDGQALQALLAAPVGGLFEQLKAQFDFVIVDSCPVLPVADALSLGQHVDAVILSVLRDVSQVAKVYSACQKLAQFGIRVLGATVQGVREDVYGACLPAGRLSRV